MDEMYIREGLGIKLTSKSVMHQLDGYTIK